MRVCLVTETYVPQVNGVSRTLGHVVNYLRKRGDAVRVIHPDYGVAAGENSSLVRAISPPFYKELFLPLPPFGGAYQAIDVFGPDVVHIATEATLGWSVLKYALRRRIPTVSSFHTNFDQYSTHYHVGFAREAIWRYLRWFHNQTIETFVPSRATISELEGRGFNRLFHWPRGVDSRLFRPERAGREAVRLALGFRPDDVVIAYVGRVAAEKNIQYLADALDLVRKALPGVRLLFVGDGPARPALEGRLGPNARFVGYRTGEDLADHYAAADLFAFASLTETFGNVILEAMASGLPVAALRAGGVGEIIRGGTGVLIKPDAPASEFAAALIRLVGDQDLRRRSARAARGFALTQNWDDILGSLRGRYQRAVASASAVGSGV